MAIRHLIERALRDPKKIPLVFTTKGWAAVFGEMRANARRRRAEAELSRRKSEWSTAWKHSDAYSQRASYLSYDEYQAHQVSKLDEMIADQTAVKSEADTVLFRRRLEGAGLVPPQSVLCLGARLGSEVEAFISLGHFAVGIDLNPGPKNSFVMTGDFHALQFADASIDCVYTNSLDHAFDVPRIASEVRRVLKPAGTFLLEAVDGFEEGYLAGPRDCTHWRTARGFAEEIARIGDFRIEQHARPAPRWQQFVMRKV